MNTNRKNPDPQNKRGARSGKPAGGTTGRRRPLLAWMGIGAAALVLAGVFSWRTDSGRAWLDDVKTEENVGGLHTTAALSYKSTPPMGGPHNPTWQNCGVFTEPVSDSHAVHSLEHGAVWITYRPEKLGPEDVAVLAAEAERNDFVIVSPYPEQTGVITLTAWNHQLVVDDVRDERVRKFVAHFVRALSSPEPGAPCDGGADTTSTTDPTETGPVMGPGVDAQKLVGMTETEAESYARNQGWGYRVGQRDSEEYMLTTDYDATRVTVKIANGTITEVAVG
jgi:hypothetical protein